MKMKRIKWQETVELEYDLEVADDMTDYEVIGKFLEIPGEPGGNIVAFKIVDVTDVTEEYNERRSKNG